MFKIKKILIALTILVLIFPIGAGAACVTDPTGLFTGCIGSTGSGGGLSGLSDLDLPSGSIYEIIQNLVYWLLGIFAFFGIIGFAVSGIMYLVSAGNDEMITKAKTYMMYSIVGVIVGLMGLVIIQAVWWMLGGYNATF
ncbi:hypothetical protein KJ761_02995 [Patescibacteria group bacterium]|nr:hypothetical protein [Patescibacteria group bacterium]